MQLMIKQNNSNDVNQRRKKNSNYIYIKIKIRKLIYVYIHQLRHYLNDFQKKNNNKNIIVLKVLK